MIDKNYFNYKNYIYEILQNEINDDEKLLIISSEIAKKLTLSDDEIIVTTKSIDRFNSIVKELKDYISLLDEALENQNHAIAMKNCLFAKNNILEIERYFL